MEDQLSQLVDAQGGCEKIQKTPLPFVYVVMIKQLILVYLVPAAGDGQSIRLVDARAGHGIVSLGLFGIEEASVEIEDPFGADDNCLDMETYTIGITRDVGQLAARQTRQTALTEPSHSVGRAYAGQSSPARPLAGRQRVGRNCRGNVNGQATLSACVPGFCEA